MAWIAVVPPSPRHPHERYQVCYREGTRQRSAGVFPTKRRAEAERRAIDRGRTELAGELSRAGIESLDAPVSGGPPGAEAASLTIMVGGSPEAFARRRRLLEVLGSLVVHVGPSGAGQAAKLCNNLIAGVTMVAIAEACAVAEREGIEPAVLYDLLTRSTGDSRVLRTRFPLAGVSAEHPASRAYEALFSLDLMAKDLDAALALAAALGVEAPVASASRGRYREAQGRGA